MVKAQSQKPYHHGNLRQVLVDEGTRLLDAAGVAQFSLREVAKAARVSHGAPYRHFKDRGALLEAIAVQGFANLTSVCQTAITAHPDAPHRQLYDAGRAYIEFALAHPGVLHLMFGGGIHLQHAGPALLQAANVAYSQLVNILENGCRNGLYRNATPENLTVAAWSMVHGLALLLTAGPLQDLRSRPKELEQVIASASVTLFEGLIAR